MENRILGKTEWMVSEISLGTWQVGGGWGKPFDQRNANEIIHTAIDNGINFIDTADVYDEGQSEAAVGKAIKERSEKIYVATKCGRQIQPHIPEGYTTKALRGFVEASLKNMNLETIDLIQLHCPPTPVYQRDDIFGLFDKLKEEGKIQALGVSVETVEEAITAMKYDNVLSIQIIFNMFRLKPAEELFTHKSIDDFGIIARVPLASGLLTGKYNSATEFAPDDHRNFNRHGEAFDKGETFSGVDYETGLKVVGELKALFGEDTALSEWAIKWILMHPQVSTVIPGASNVNQVESNVKSSEHLPISPYKMEAVKDLYEKYLKDKVHDLW
ncbi:aldo/keto reductase [Aquiflexum sp.]|uniref:aldo/keto reductase n=1 Tax=Aquiflexum sp. TaxID=1872584 RepID=UPI0035934896